MMIIIKGTESSLRGLSAYTFFRYVKLTKQRERERERELSLIHI